METKSARFNFNPLRFSLPVPKQAQDRRSMIEKAAYYRAERRNFAPGHEVQDWLAAEKEVDQLLAGARLR